MKSKRFKLCQLDMKMCLDYDLKQAMDYDDQQKKVYDKGRGYAVMLVQVKGLTFAIPLRSYMPKNYQLKYKLRESNKQGYVEGLDFGKVLIVEHERYIKSEFFKLREIEDYYKLIVNDRIIVNKLIRVIHHFNLAYEKQDVHKLTDPKRFKFTTLFNYIDRIKSISDKDFI